MSSYNNRSVS